MTRRSPTARRLAPVTVLLALGSPALASCGFDYQTNQVNTITHSATQRTDTVAVLGSVLVSAQPGSGTLVATFVNSDREESAGVEAVAGTGEPVVDAPEFEPVEIPPQERAVLAETGGIAVEGDFVPGDFAPIEFTFADGSSIELDVPVVPPCRQWEGLDDSADDADSLQPEAADPEIEEPEGKAEEPAEVPESDQTPYDCVLPEPFEH